MSESSVLPVQSAVSPSSGGVELRLFGGLVEQLGSGVESAGVDCLVGGYGGETHPGEHVDPIEIAEVHSGNKAHKRESKQVALLAEIRLSEPCSCAQYG